MRGQKWHLPTHAPSTLRAESDIGHKALMHYVLMPYVTIFQAKNLCIFNTCQTSYHVLASLQLLDSELPIKALDAVERAGWMKMLGATSMRSNPECV